MSARANWLFALVIIIALGLLSRIFPLGYPLWDKYLGDALYAATVYALLRLLTEANAASVLTTSSAIMVTIEAFQLTGMTALMLERPQPAVRIFARLLGTQFSFFDLLAYAVGLYLIFEWDRASRKSI